MWEVRLTALLLNVPLSSFLVRNCLKCLFCSNQAGRNLAQSRCLLQPSEGQTSDSGLAALLLGPDIAQQLYGDSSDSLEALIPSLSLANTPFLLRLRDTLAHCCMSVGVDATFTHVQLPIAIGQYLAEVSSPHKAVKVAHALSSDLSADDILARQEGEEEQREFPEELKEQVLRLYNKGVKANFLSALFNIGSPKLVHSWGNWKYRPPAEMERCLARRSQILTLLEQGQSSKAICSTLGIKYKILRETLGQACGTVYSRAAYEKVMQQMHLLKVKSAVSKCTGVSVYIMNKWLEGKDVPDEEFLVDDEAGSAEAKKAAIEAYYESGSLDTAGEAAGVDTEVVKRWVGQFQVSCTKKKKKRRSRKFISPEF